MSLTKIFHVIDYVPDHGKLTDVSDDFWTNRMEKDIIHFITREKQTPREEIKIIINHPYEGNVLIINDQYIFYYIHKICKDLTMSPSQFTFNTSNWQIFKQYIYWKKQGNYYYDDRINLECEFLLSRIYAPKLFDIPNKNGVIPKINYEQVPDEPVDKELVFNCLNKQPNRHRITLYKELMEKQLMHKGIVTFNKVGDTTLNGVIPEYLKKQLPITYDVQANNKEKVMSYGDIEFTEAIGMSNQTNISNQFAEFFNKTHLTVVTETLLGNMNNEYNDCSSRKPHTNNCNALMDYDPSVDRMICPICQSQKVNVPQWVKFYYCGFITEKTFRQFLNGHPMLWIAPPYTLKMLRHLGFNTFDNVWKEDYDEIIDPRKRINRVITILIDLCNKDKDEWRVINRKLIPILKHNQQVMLNLTETPKLNWDNLPEFITNNKFKDIYDRYLLPEQGIQAVAHEYFEGNLEKAQKKLELIK
tara:strand:- start:352 stop:1770 length:1419 start_codon:yes stop_codon:yes gene_type:complete